MSDVLSVSNINAAHCLDLYVDSTGSGSKRIIYFCHVENRNDTIIVPATISERTAGVARKENDVEVGHIDWRFVSNGKAWMRRDKANGCIRTCYVQEGMVEDLDKGRGRIGGIKPHKGVVCTPMFMVYTYNIIFEGVNVLNVLIIFSYESVEDILQRQGVK